MSKRPRAGDLRHVIQLQTKSTALDSYGQVSDSSTDWSGGARMRARVEQLSGSEGELARQRFPSATHRISIDYSSTLDSTGATGRRFTFGSRRFHILEIRNIEEEAYRMDIVAGEER